jgi:hypothetical protein
LVASKTALIGHKTAPPLIEENFVQLSNISTENSTAKSDKFISMHNVKKKKNL